MSGYCRKFVIALVLIGTGAVLSAAESSDSKVLRLGEIAPPFTFTDIHYLPRSLKDCGKKQAYVIVFTTLDCPLVQRYLPQLKALDEAYRDRDVQFVALNVGCDDSLVEVAYQAVKVDLAFPVGKDFDGAAAAALGVRRTPEVVVLDADGRLRYRGRINAQYRLGGVRPDAAREDLQEAIDDILSGKSVRTAETPVDGCLIEFDALKALPASVPSEVTYTEHIAPLVAKHCQDCHRDNAAAPFSLTSYRDVLAHADTIAEVVRQGRMPPSFSSREHGEFINTRRLTASERALLLSWVRRGKPEGDATGFASSSPSVPPRWRIPEPDLELKMAIPAEIPETGYIPYRYALLPHVFLHDTWVQGVEILPGNRTAVHHCNMAYVQAGGPNDTRNFITGYVPGGDAMLLDSGVGFKIPAGSMLLLQIHYVTTGKAATDQTSVGLVYAKQKVQKQLRHFECVNHRFEIPPGASHHEVAASRTFPCNATGVGMFSHMHLRGKDMVFRAFYPDGHQDTLLAVPNYSFDWQLSYRWPADTIRFPKGSRVECVAHFDNSPFNPYNPDPTVTVREGQQSFEEMMYGFLFYTDDDESLGLNIDGKTGRVIEPGTDHPTVTNP